MARICREAGARVRTNVMVRDLDLAAFNHLDGRRLEIIADGLSLWRGAQLAIDTTTKNEGAEVPRARSTPRGCHGRSGEAVLC